MTRRRRSGPTWEPSHAELVALVVTRDELHRLEGRASSSAEAWGPPDPEDLEPVRPADKFELDGRAPVGDP